MGEPHGIGIVGLGVISGQYLDTLGSDGAVRIVATADLNRERAEAVAERYHGARAMTVEDLVADPAVQTVLNLTIPAAHAEVARAALAAGKNVYGEKPLAASLTEALEVVRTAGQAWVGGAPDTVLGTGVQTARAVVDAGEIGCPIAAVATWLSSGHEAWHPHPDFYYREGGGPLYDMGPYYLTALFHVLGPVERVTGHSSRSRDYRTIGSGPRAGELIPVEVDTHVTGILEHAGGAVSTVTFSFDAVSTHAVPIEVHGEAASLTLPDPNFFDGDVTIRRAGDADWSVIAPRAGYRGAGRGIGVLDYVRGDEGAGRANGDVALHVLEIMSALTESAQVGRPITLTTTAARPALVPLTEELHWRTP